LDKDTGEIRVYGLSPAWQPFTPLADGCQALRGWMALTAHCRVQTLVLTVSRLGSRRERAVRVFRGPTGIPAGEYPVRGERSGVALSADGERLAHLSNEYRVKVCRVGADQVPLLATDAGGFSPPQRLTLGKGWLLLATAKHHVHLARWDRGPLELLHGHDRHGTFSLETLYTPRHGKPPLGAGVEGSRQALPAWTSYDPQRFVLAAATDVVAVADCFGQVAMFDHAGKLMCMFFAFRNRFAAWLPDGTRYGPPSVSNGPATPDALAKIGQALRRAAGRR
jgi:hypothetical protein